MEEQPKKNIYQKLLEIQKRVIGLGKNKDGHNYKYVTGEKVLEHLKPLMNEYGILLKQEVLSIENTRQDYATKFGTSSEMHSKVMMRFTWVDCDTGEKDENLFGANGQNAWDKGAGSALTYGERYFLLKYFHIATDEDDLDNPELKAQQEAEAKKILDAAIKEVKTCKDKECTVSVWNKYPTLKTVDAFKNAVAEKGKSFEEKAPPQPENEPEQTFEQAQLEHNAKEAEIQEAEVVEEQPQVKYASAKQKEEIIRLLNNPVITRQEKTKMLLNIQRFDEKRASEAIEKLKKVIEDRSEGTFFNPAREDQKQEVAKLNNHKCFTKEEKADTLKELAQASQEAAEFLIDRLNQQIAERTAK